MLMLLSRFNGNFISAYLREYLHYSRILQALIALKLQNVYFLFKMGARCKTYFVYKLHGMRRLLLKIVVGVKEFN